MRGISDGTVGRRDLGADPPPDPPTLVLVLTDDLDVGTTNELPRIFDLVAAQGGE